MKKRVHVPFPPAAVNSSTVVKPRKLAKTTIDSTGNALQERIHHLKEALKERDIIKQKEIDVLQAFSADIHPYSIQLCRELENLKSQPHSKLSSLLPPEIVCISQAGGRISFDVQLASRSGYGCAVWSFCLGGGVGDDRSPIALRCTNLISHYQVDDMGFISAIFWETLKVTKSASISDQRSVVQNAAGVRVEAGAGKLPGLVDVLRGVVNMLLGPFVKGSSSQYSSNTKSVTDGKLSNGEVEGTAHVLEQDLDLDGYSPEEHQHRWKTAETETERKAQPRLAYLSKALVPALFCVPSSTATGDTSGKGDNRYCNHRVDTELVCGSDWPDLNWLAPSFPELLEALRTLSNPNTPAAQQTVAELRFRTLVTESSPGIFTFDLFSLSFCDTLLQELDNYDASGLPQRRPNTMNNYGLVLNEIGMQPLMDSLLLLVEPLATRLFPAEPVVHGLDHHHTFLVQYKSNHLKGDRGLDMHHDASEVTLNVCLGRDNFQGGDLLFCGMADLSDHRKYQFSLKHVKGRAVMHLGRHRHGAEDILPASSDSTATSMPPTHNNGSTNSTSTGIVTDADCASIDSERLNLIMWLRSSIFRSAAAYGHISPDGFPKMKEDVEPDICCLSKYNDTDYHTFVSQH